MSAVVEAMSELLNFPETLEKLVFSSARPNDADQPRAASGASFPADILDAPKEYRFYLDVPGLSKSDIQVTVEDENTLVIKSNGKRKREEGEDEGSNGKRKREEGEDVGCKCVRLERRPPQKLTRKFKLPENCNVSAITAKCENGVLTVVVEKLPPPPKAKTVEVAIA